MDSPSPNPVSVAWTIGRALRTRRPRPTGSDAVDHSELQPILNELQAHGIGALAGLREELSRYRKGLEEIDADELTTDEALAYWLNLYNAGALDLAAAAAQQDKASVLRVDRAFTSEWAVVAGESVSLQDIEHGKIRRFRDPRIHGALICGTASCPTLRLEPYTGEALDSQLENQMNAFLGTGGAHRNEADERIHLSCILLWYGGDFTRPHRMPTWIPPARRRLLESLYRWLDPGTIAWAIHTRPSVVFQSYDWSLACAVA